MVFMTFANKEELGILNMLTELEHGDIFKNVLLSATTQEHHISQGTFRIFQEPSTPCPHTRSGGAYCHQVNQLKSAQAPFSTHQRLLGVGWDASEMSTSSRAESAETLEGVIMSGCIRPRTKKW